MTFKLYNLENNTTQADIVYSVFISLNFNHLS